MLEPPTAPVVEPVRRRLARRLVVGVGAVVLGASSLAAVSVAVAQSRRVSRLSERVAALEAGASAARDERAKLDGRATALEQTLAAVRKDLTAATLRITVARVDIDELQGNLSSTTAADVTTLERKIDDLESDVAELRSANELRADEISSLADCVDTYMDTVARAGGGRYTYYRC